MESIYANVSRGDISKFFKLCLDVARWYAAHNTSQMRYQAETKRYKFCEKFVRYISGYKNADQVQGSSTRGELLPSQSPINFAVPRGDVWVGVCSCAAVDLRPLPLIRANFW